MLDTYATSLLGVLVTLSGVKKLQGDIGIHGEYITHKCKVHTVDNSKITLSYKGNTEPGNVCYNYVIAKNLP